VSTASSQPVHHSEFSLQRQKFASDGDLRVVEITGKLDANGVYEARVQLRKPDGVWVDKVDSRGKLMENSIFPVDWGKKRIKVEIDSAWKDRKPGPFNKIKWIGTSSSGVDITGYLEPRVTAFPVHIGVGK
jgi:hypothetical protein